MKQFAACLTLFLAAASPGLAQGSPEPEPEIYYDLYVADSCLTVWVDIYPLLTPRVWERLSDGVDIALDCRAELHSPRRFWSDRLEAEVSRTIRLSYRKLTQDFTLDAGVGDTGRIVATAAVVEQFLRDSIELCLRPMSLSDLERTLRITLRITSIYLTDLNLADEVASGNGGDSPVRYLFRQFLELTDYGRREFTVRSRPFSLGELPRVP